MNKDELIPSPNDFEDTDSNELNFLDYLHTIDTDDSLTDETEHDDFRLDEFKPEELDLIILADFYLTEVIKYSCSSFFEGVPLQCSAERARSRFEQIANHLPNAKRQEVIRSVECRESHSRGDHWEVFKYRFDWGLWSWPVDMDAVLRIAESTPERRMSVDEPLYGSDFLATMREVRERERGATHQAASPKVPPTP